MAEGVIPVQTHLFNGQTRSFNKRRSYHEGDDIRYTKKVLKKRSEDIDEFAQKSNDKRINQGSSA